MLDWITAHKELSAALASWAQVLALVAGIFALIKYFSERKRSREAGARNLYTQFMTTSIDQCDMYGGAWTDGSLASKSLKYKYIYYVGLFLWSAEEILREFGNDKAWKETLRVTMREHKDYLASNDFDVEEGGYSEELKRLIRKTV